MSWIKERPELFNSLNNFLKYLSSNKLVLAIIILFFIVPLSIGLIITFYFLSLMKFISNTPLNIINMVLTNMFTFIILTALMLIMMLIFSLAVMLTEKNINSHLLRKKR